MWTDNVAEFDGDKNVSYEFSPEKELMAASDPDAEISLNEKQDRNYHIQH